MSRQRDYQLRQKAQGLCMLCPEPLFNKHCCLKHAVKRREYQARTNKSKKKYWCASRMAQNDRGEPRGTVTHDNPKPL